MPQPGRALAAGALTFVLALAAVGSARAEGLRHTVSPGETLSYLSQVYAVTVGEIVDLNSLSDPDVIFPGQVGPRLPRFPAPSPPA